jgi:uncharacterized iron-regulated membrane protein
MRWLRSLHRWTGLAAATFLLLLALSGGALVFKEEIWALRYPALGEVCARPSAAEHAAAFEASLDAFPGRVSMVRTPREGLPAYHVYLEDGEALLHQITHEVIDEWVWYETPTGILAELHFHLMAGDAGRVFVGVLGLVGGGMALSGLWLWWPVRRQFRAGSFWPERLSRLHLLRLHRDFGAVTATFIVLFALTGAAVVFGDAARFLFNAVLMGQATELPALRREATAPLLSPPDATIIETAQSRLPKALLRSWSPPADGSAVHYFRFRQPAEPHPNGRSTVYVDAINGAVLQATDAMAISRGDRLANWMYPLHSATVGGWPYRVVALLAALALAVMSVTGAVSFFKKNAVRR